jgi:four helix bundle protein
MLNLKHKNLDVWKLSIDIVRELYKMTESFPKSEIFGLTDQIRRSAVSLPLNIAEGSSRKSSLERKRFYEIARSSLVEIDTQLEVCIALKFIENNNISIVDDKLNHLFAMLTNLIKKT